MCQLKSADTNCPIDWLSETNARIIQKIFLISKVKCRFIPIAEARDFRGMLSVNLSLKKLTPAQIQRGVFLSKRFLVCSERQERNVAGAFNGDCHLTLMLGAVARNAARKNFTALSREAAKFCRVFVIYSFNFIDAKCANLSARASTSFSAHLQSSLKRRVFRVNGLAAEVVIISSRRSLFATI